MKIELTEKTKANVRELIRTINELQIRLQLILTTIVDECGGDVNKYRLDDNLDLVEIDTVSCEDGESVGNLSEAPSVREE